MNGSRCQCTLSVHWQFEDFDSAVTHCTVSHTVTHQAGAVRVSGIAHCTATATGTALAVAVRLHCASSEPSSGLCSTAAELQEPPFLASFGSSLPVMLSYNVGKKRNMISVFPNTLSHTLSGSLACWLTGLLAMVCQ